MHMGSITKVIYVSWALVISDFEMNDHPPGSKKGFGLR